MSARPSSARSPTRSRPRAGCPSTRAFGHTGSRGSCLHRAARLPGFRLQTSGCSVRPCCRGERLGFNRAERRGAKPVARSLKPGPEALCRLRALRSGLCVLHSPDWPSYLYAIRKSCWPISIRLPDGTMRLSRTLKKLPFDDPRSLRYARPSRVDSWQCPPET